MSSDIANIKSTSAAELPTEAGLGFLIYESGSWLLDSTIKATALETVAPPVVLDGAAGSQVRLMGTYHILEGRKMNGHPIFTMSTENISETGQLAEPGEKGTGAADGRHCSTRRPVPS
mmetsp:Transcript_68909/g.192529  ORF Transcript_68909/g.192529 Transcript_68909/m.192529 type:complete len:118 (+) Transcript_68909:273-626(+)